MIGTHGRVSGAQGESVNEVTAFGQRLEIASDHKFANFGQRRVADGGDLDERKVADLEIGIRTQRDDGVEEVRLIHAEP